MSAASSSFEPHRPRLMRIAYRMLGSVSDAEDVVQDAYVRWHESDQAAIQSVEGLLVKTVVRLAIDRQRKLQTERTSYYGSWLPEPWLGGNEAERGDDLGYAAQVLLERLSAEERAAFLLREVFDVDYEVIADTLQKSEPAVRKLVQRAKERLAEGEAAPDLSSRAGGRASTKQPTSREEQRQLLSQLITLSRATDSSELERLLSPAMRLVSDGGGKVFAARYILEGAVRVAKTLRSFIRKGGGNFEDELVELFGEPAVAMYIDGKLYGVNFASVRDGRIQELYMLLNPDKLRRLEPLLARK